MAEDSVISTSGGGMSMGVDVFVGSAEAKIASKGEVDLLRSASN